MSIAKSRYIPSYTPVLVLQQAGVALMDRNADDPVQLRCSRSGVIKAVKVKVVLVARLAQIKTGSDWRKQMRLAIATVTVLALGSLAAAQHQQGHTPYAGLQNRAVKALSEQQVSDLRSGRGMGLALSAELNGYPGPLHVLELADQLELSAALRERVRLLYDDMKAEAVPVGETLVAYENELDRALLNEPYRLIPWPL
jgi:hypothetical protein